MYSRIMQDPEKERRRWTLLHERIEALSTATLMKLYQEYLSQPDTDDERTTDAYLEEHIISDFPEVFLISKGYTVYKGGIYQIHNPFDPWMDEL